MPRFAVSMERVRRETRTVIVEADDEHQATAIAVENDFDEDQHDDWDPLDPEDPEVFDIFRVDDDRALTPVPPDCACGVGGGTAQQDEDWVAKPAAARRQRRLQDTGYRPATARPQPPTAATTNPGKRQKRRRKPRRSSANAVSNSSNQY